MRDIIYLCVTNSNLMPVTLRKKFTNTTKLISQQKTKESVTIELHNKVLQILGNPTQKKEVVFSLPSHAACNKSLKFWCKKVGIDKHITRHCAKHSFATNLIYYGADVNTASNLLGHNSLRYTERYTHIINH